MKIYLILMGAMMSLTACQTSPTIEHKPIHTVNPEPAPILTKHHANHQLNHSQIIGKWQFKNASMINNNHQNELLTQLNHNAYLIFTDKGDDNQIGILASIGCNTRSITRLIDDFGILSNMPDMAMIGTLKSCGRVSDGIENRFGAFLWDAHSVQLQNGTLILTDKYGNVLTFDKVN